MIWTQLQISGCKKLFICSLYWPPNALDTEYLDSLNEALSHIAETAPSAHIWIGEDFNLADINWEDTSSTSCTQYSKISNQLLDIMNDHSLTQIIDKPTRTTETTQNIFDLFFTNYPDMVNRHDVIPGLSDHDIPLLDTSTKISINKKAPRKVYLYRKGNMEGLVSDLTDFSIKFCKHYDNPKAQDVNIMWDELKQQILDSMGKHISSKMIHSSKHQAAWINSQIKRDIKKRNRLYSTAKSSTNTSDFKDRNRLTQSAIRKAYLSHIENNILDETDEENFGETQRKFWRYVQSMKKDRTGTSPLKENGLLVSDSKSKAEILSRQCKSVFNQETEDNIPEPDEPELPTMTEITVTEGVLKLLLKLKVNKASGPDHIPAKILKAAAKPLSVPHNTFQWLSWIWNPTPWLVHCKYHSDI